MYNQYYFNQILSSFNIKANCIHSKIVDNYFYYDLKLDGKTRVKDISKYSDEISLALKTNCRPSIKIIHDQGLVRLEFVSSQTKPLMLFDYFTNGDIPLGDAVCLLGKTVDGNKLWVDLAKNPHMLIAGTTGSGKSVLLHNLIANLLNYNNCSLCLIDPKRIEFYKYDNKFKNVNVCYSFDETIRLLDNILQIMEERYSKVRAGYCIKNFPYITVIIDEFSDLIMQDKENLFFNKLCRLAQKSRAARISIILATQRPSSDIINGTIKANFPARIACKVASQVDSKVILNTSGAENLLGKGDALFHDNYRLLERFQIAYTSLEEICRVFANG